MSVLALISCAFISLSILTSVGFAPDASSSLRLKQVVIPTDSPTAIASTTPIPTPVLPQNQASQEQLAKLERELDTLRDQRTEDINTRADSIVSLANAVVETMALIVALIPLSIGLIVLIAAFFGVRELSRIRTLSRTAEREVTQLRRSFEESIVTQGENLNRETQTLREQLSAQDLNFRASTEELAAQFQEEVRALTHSFRETINESLNRQSQNYFELSYNFTAGTTAYKEGENELAIEYFRRVINMQPNAPTYCGLGKAYVELGRTGEAIESFNAALALQPTSSQALLGLASAHRYVDPDKAISFARTATEHDPSNYDAFNYLGLLYRDSEHFRDALDMHRQALQIRPRAVTYFYISLLLAREGDLVVAHQMLDRAVLEIQSERKWQGLKPIWMRLIECCDLLMDGKQDEAVSCAQEMCKVPRTERTTRAIQDHVVFLLNSLGKPELIQIFAEICFPNTTLR